MCPPRRGAHVSTRHNLRGAERVVVYRRRSLGQRRQCPLGRPARRVQRRTHADAAGH